MYKILITTTYFIGDGSSVHTVVVEFNQPHDARKAVELVNEKRSTPAAYKQHAIALF